MLKIGDLPAHPLVVHAPVVLVPLVAGGLVAFFLVPSWRRLLGPVLVALAAVAAGSAILAVASGEALGDALNRGDELAAHRGYGERARLLTVLLATATGGLVLYDRRRGRPERWLRRATAAVAIVAVGAVASVFLTGHTGAQLAWAEKLPDPDAPVAASPGGGAGAAAVTPSTAPEPTHDTHLTTQPSGAPSTTPTSATALPGSPSTASEPEVHVVLGEWALIGSVAEAPSGPITFRFHNAGTVPHAFRIRSEDESGSDRLEWRSTVVAPGQEATLTADLPPGAYELDCPIEDGHGEHDALGMEMPFNVHAAAPPLVVPATAEPTTVSLASTASPTPSSTTAPSDRLPPVVVAAPDESPATPVTIDIQAFAFQPADTRVRVGDEVTWANHDPTAHNATGDDWSTGPLGASGTGSVKFGAAGTYLYECTLHPSMTGRIIVDP